VLKALAELYDLSLAEFLEDMVRDAFRRSPAPLSVALAQAAEPAARLRRSASW
jgi:hypothetical protein